MQLSKHSQAPRSDLLRALVPATWCRDTLGLDPDPWQQKVLESRSRFSILACARQVGKSTIVAVKVIHRAMTRPGSMVLIIAPSLRQSIELMTKVRNLLKFAGAKLVSDNKTEAELANGSRIVALPGSEDTVRGFSAVDLIVIDEAAFAKDDLYYSVYPMIQISRGSMILLSSAYITNGFYYDIWHGSDERWERHRITAYECPRYDHAELEYLRESIPAKKFQCEYLAEFVDPEGAAFTAEQIEAMFDNDVVPFGMDNENAILDDRVEAFG